MGYAKFRKYSIMGSKNRDKTNENEISQENIQGNIERIVWFQEAVRDIWVNID
jgi:hypothetical protein